jgi:chemosensory pili system protein ChpA (sensor histidine kinase/response regulator)
LSRRIGALQLRAQVAKEIFANLRHVEQVLDAFARGAVERDTLQGLKPYLRQIHGALAVLRLDHAVEVLTICDRMIAECVKTDHTQTAWALDWIAEGLSTLGFYLEPCLHGGEPTEQAIRLFFSRFDKRDAPATQEKTNVITIIAASAKAAEQFAVVAPPGLDTGRAPPVAETGAATAPEPEKSEAAAAPQPPVDDEILAIFLDEAGEVLANIEAALPMCREQPHNRDALATIRRGFHTLKGSGRMVGLTDLGEIAWEIEQVMNLYLEQQRPASPGLLDLITMASASFAAWVAHPRAGEPLTVDGQRITDLARRLRAGGEPAASSAAAPAVEREAPVAAQLVAATAGAPGPEPEEVAVGDILLTRSLFDIYLKEAAQHVSALEAEYNEWCNTPEADGSHEMLRAAHTLASSSRTAGFTAIADLAGAIEHWTPLARQVTEEADLEAVESAIQRLREMIVAVALRQPPAPAEDAVRRLDDLTSRLRARVASPPPVDSKPAAAGADAVPAMPAIPATVLESVPAPEGKERRKMRDDIDEQLLPIFLEEARELLPLIGSDLREWKANPGDDRISQSLRRALHTLKGSARMAGVIRLGEFTHLMESRIEEATKANQLPAELFEDLEFKMDRLSMELDRMQEDQALLKIPPSEPVAAPWGEVPHGAEPRAEPPLPSPAVMLRINADTLDHLINASGEVSIARSRIEAELRVVKQSLADLNDSITRMRGQLREVEMQADSQLQSRASMLDESNRDFDPLEFDRYTRLQELTRLMGESLHDATSIQQGLLKNLGETDSALLQQARISRDVQQELMRTRAAPFSNLNERLYRIVRQVARELDKTAELEIEGSQVELDRGVLEKIGAPLEMLRNALAHGLEFPAARAAAGKPESGRITINLRQESNEVALVVSDDGAGLDLETLHRIALDKGILRRDQDVTEAELVQLVFAGFSTAEEVTELSGRGVGMDVVRNEISAIGGRVEIATVRGKGTTFTIYLPLTLAVTQAVMVRAGGSVLAISSAMVEQVLRLKADDMAGLYEKKAVASQDRSYPLYYLPHLLGATDATKVQNYNSILLLRSGVQRIALHVDELIGNQEIVVKNIGPQLSRVPGIAGATVLADGRIALIVNPVQLAQRADRAAPPRAAAPAVALIKPAGPVIMVVDDSLTVRKVTSRLLEREGYLVLMAKDGVDALEQMRDTLPDVMLVDIEMPRMDGFDLAKIVRRDPRTQRIPIIIISSRNADKHRSLAAEIGVNAFLGKPFQESDLLEHVSRYLVGKKQTVSHH